MLDRCRQYGDQRLLEVTEERNGPSGLRDDDDDDDINPRAAVNFFALFLSPKNRGWLAYL